VPVSRERKELFRPVYIQMMNSSAVRQAVSRHTNELLTLLSQGGLDNQLAQQIGNIMDPFATSLPEDISEEEFDFLASRLVDEMLAVSLAGAVTSVMLIDGEGGISPLNETFARIEQFGEKLKKLAAANHALLTRPMSVN
jgi:hypothetical protein